MYFVFVFVFCIICLLSMFAFVRQQHLKGFLFAQELTYKCTQLNLLTGSSKICKKKKLYFCLTHKWAQQNLLTGLRILIRSSTNVVD